MAIYRKLYMVLLTVVFISQSACVTQFLPAQIPRQITLRQVITGQNLEEEQQDFFRIDEGRTAVGGPGRGTGSFLQSFPIPLLTLVVPMVAMAIMTMMSRTPTNIQVTVPDILPSRTPTNVQVIVPGIVPTTQTAALPIPCVPTNCPEGYMLLFDQTASPNCYFHSEQNIEATWANALAVCTMTPGASLWRPNTEAEADAVFKQFQCSTFIWTGANRPGQNGNFVFAGDNADFDYLNVPFGNTFTFRNFNCIGIETDGPSPFFWSDELCTEEYQYVCEFPRKTCP